MAKQKAQTSKGKSKSKITPLGDRVIVRPLTEEEVKGKQSFGIILPDSMTKEKSGEGRVVAVGEGAYQDGKLIAPKVRVGDTVLFSKYSYDEITIDGEDLYIIRGENVLAIIG
jgi:chaperonin GroES